MLGERLGCAGLMLGQRLRQWPGIDPTTVNLSCMSRHTGGSLCSED